MKRGFLLFALTIIVNSGLIGQDVFYQTLGSKQGLSQSSAIAFWQDDIGRMWIGNDALNCYNGEEIVVYRISEHIPDAEDSNIHNITGDSTALFFLAANRIICFDLITETFHDTGINAHSFSYVNNNIYYLSNEGLFNVYDRKSNTTQTIIHLPEIAKGSDCVLKTDERTCWVGTPTGVYLIDLEKKEILNHFLPDEQVVVLFKDSRDYIWITSFQHHVNKYTIYIYTPDGQFFPLQLNGKRSTLGSNSIFCIREDIKGIIWIGTLTGIYKLSRNADNISFTLEDHVLKESSVYGLYSDRQGTIWIGPYFGDVRYHNPYTDNYTYYETDESNPNSLHGAVIGRITKDKYGNKYLATEGSGINIMKLGSSTFEHLTIADGLPQNKIRDLWYDEEYDRLYISAYMEGICYLDPKTRQIYRIAQDSLKTINQLIIERFHPYKEDLILHTQNGLFRLDRKTQAIDWFFPEGELRERCSGIIRTLHIDDKETLWVSSYRNGLFTIDLKTGKVMGDYGDGVAESSKIPGAILKIVGDSRRGIYLATMKSGILKYITETDSFIVFDVEKNTLLSDICYNIAFSRKNTLILTSNRGISLLDIAADNTLRSAYHLRINQTSPLSAFNIDCDLYVSQDGNQIFAGCLYGLLCFSEKDLPVDQGSYSLYFSSLTINNELVHPNSSFLDKSLYLTDKLVLPHNKNTFSLKFASSNYLTSRSQRYEFLLQGGSEDIWTEIDHKTIIFNSLRSGNYKLLVREVANPLKKTELDIIIKSPWWATTPAILIYILLGAIFLIVFIQFFKSKTQLQASLEMERRENVRIEETNRQRMDFFMNIANEFRTPLTLILSLIERLPPDMLSSGKSKIERIKRQALHMQDLITEIVDFRKIGQNQFNLKVENHDLVKFMHQVYVNFNDYAGEKQLSFKLRQNHESIPLWFDQRRMQKVLYNLLSYIFKASFPKDSVTLSTHRMNGFYPNTDHP